ncbi:hypothetical protein [Streptomyces showdoensis]|uniref:Uncharacterized protein n=1 Tax=Streptomyces showdoensis TaxID=68268 RepID=A0A2P2GR32_STREW|nr:hypothetical protein [Streptomyces showdoensis]KKZ73957.1 hypothetical protein VO63_10130 [Streptomyces showdoensis]
MAGTVPHTTRDPRAERSCPACGEPLHVHAQRHKVLGAWVPEWEVEPCRNPRCERYEPPGGEVPEERPVVGAEAASTHLTGKNGENGETGRSPAPG